MSGDEQNKDRGFDLDEDLFDFDELRGEASLDDEDADLDEIFATFNEREFDPPAAMPAVAEAPAAAGPAPAPQPAAEKPHLVPPTAPAATAPPSSTPPPAAVFPQPQAPAAPVPSAPGETRLRLSPSVLLIFAALTAMNGLVALVAVKSSSDVRSSIEEVGDELGSLTNETIELARDAEETLRHSQDPFGVDIRPEDHPTLDEVEEDIRRGEFERARRRVYSLLAILDRIEPAKREEIERRATFLLGSARHLEALQRAGEDGP